MDIIVNKVSCYRSDENNFNMLFSFLETHCAVSAYNVSSMYKISKNLWQITYYGGYVKYYKFGPIFNYGNDKVALSRKLGSDLNITYVETTFKDVKSVIKDIFPIEDRVQFVRISNQEILIHELCYAKDYLNILSGKYPYFRVKLLVGEEAKASGVVKVVNKMLSDQIRDLELTIKSTEAGLVAKRNLLNELLLKQSESEKV